MREVRTVNLWTVKTLGPFFVGIRHVDNPGIDGAATIIVPQVIMGDPLTEFTYRVGKCAVLALHRLSRHLLLEFTVGRWVSIEQFDKVDDVEPSAPNLRLVPPIVEGEH